MTLENIYYIGQTIAVVAILGSLIALIFQLKEQRRESRLAARHALSVEYRKIMDPMHEVPGFAHLWTKSLSVGLHGLEPHEFNIVGSFVQNTLRCFEEFMIQRRNGRLDENTWGPISKHLAEFVSTKGFQDYWVLREEIYTDDFRTWVANLEKREYRGANLRDPQRISAPETSPASDSTDAEGQPQK